MDLSIDELRKQLRTGQVAKPGDRVSLLTEDYETHTSKVVELTDNAIHGNVTKILIDEIAKSNSIRNFHSVSSHREFENEMYI